MGTLAKKARIGVWVQASRALAEVQGTATGKILRLYMQNPAI